MRNASVHTTLAREDAHPPFPRTRKKDEARHNSHIVRREKPLTSIAKMLKRRHLVIAAAQMRFRATVRENLEVILSTIQALAKQGVDAILFPECALTGYHRGFDALNRTEIERALGAVAQAARTAGCHVLVGTPTFDRGKRFNSLVVLDRRGRKLFCYSKIHLTARDARFFTPGNRLALFHLDGIPCTAIICHERRYPELVRLPVMMGAQIVFHPNAGLDSLAISKRKRRGRDGIAARAFENEVYYVFANSVGRQGGGLWSAGDSKIVAPNSELLALADNRNEMCVRAKLDLNLAGRRYAREALEQPAFLRRPWKAMLRACARQMGALRG